MDFSCGQPSRAKVISTVFTSTVTIPTLALCVNFAVPPLALRRPCISGASNREERIRLFVGYLNIVAAGTLVGALVTEPLAWAVNDKVEVSYRMTFELVSIFASVGVELVALAIILKFLP